MEQTLNSQLHEVLKAVEYRQDAAGWKSVVFLPYNLIWRVIILMTILYVFATTTTLVTYNKYVLSILYGVHVCDIFYFFDFLCSALHRGLMNTRKLKSYIPKPYLLLFIDLLSLIPFNLIYVVVIWHDDDRTSTMQLILLLNRNFRLYTIYYYFSQLNYSILSVYYGYLIKYFEMTLYFTIVCHIGSCTFHALKTEQDIASCPEFDMKCILLTEVDILTLLYHRYVGGDALYDTWQKRITICVFLLIGHLYMYGYMAPMFVFSCSKHLRNFFEFFNRYRRLKIFLNNLIENEELKSKALKEFRTVWTYYKGDVMPVLLKRFPANMIKNCYCDMYWDSMKHSALLNNISLGCKRSLSMYITGDFFMPNTIVWNLDENKNCIIYVASGILQIMAEENESSPILSFSGGTILGEMSVFCPTKTKAILRVATFSELHILQAKHLFRVTQKYPSDRLIIMKNYAIRLRIAKTTYLRKRKIKRLIYDQGESEMEEFNVQDDDSVKWIKEQSRIISTIEKEGHDRTQLGHMLKTSIDHTSVCLPLLNLGDDIERRIDVACLKTTIPWVMDPASHFIKMWNNFTLILISIICVMYPAIIGWSEDVPDWLVSVSEIICIIFLIDLMIQLSTAAKTKTGLIVSSGGILRNRLKRLTFYADILSSIPTQLYFSDSPHDDSYLRLSIALALLKVYRLITYLNAWCENLWGKFRLRIMIKYLLYYVFTLYWSATVFHLMDVKCLYDICSQDNWYSPALNLLHPEYENLASSYFSLNLVGGVPNFLTYTQSYPSVLYVLISFQISSFIMLAWIANFCAAYILEISQEVKYKSLIQSVTNFMNTRNIVPRVKKRIMEAFYFQWYYDCGDSITQNRSMLEDAPDRLKLEINRMTIFQSIKNCELLTEESEEFVWYLCNKTRRLSLPANAILVTFGVQTMTFYIVYKGYISVNSFLSNDVKDSISYTNDFGPGKILPLLIALNQMPSVVTARTATDTELIVVKLEDFLIGAIMFDAFKDIVEAIKTVDLGLFLNARLHISKIKDSSEMLDKTLTREPFKKYGFVGWLFWCFLMKTTVNNHGANYLRWEFFRLFTILISAIVWPVAFIVVPSSDRLRVIGLLLLLDLFGLIDLYIKSHVCFYNKYGIYVTHPLTTAMHYLTTGFLIDSLFLLPACHSIYVIITDPDIEFSSAWVVTHNFIRYISLIRILFFMRHRDSIGTDPLKSFGVLIYGLIGLHIFIATKLRSECRGVVNPDGTVTWEIDETGWISATNIESEEIFYNYFLLFYVVFVLILRSCPIFRAYTLATLLYTFVFSTFGLIVTMFFYAYFITRKTGLKINFTIYQFHMKNFKNFMRTEKADDRITEMAVKYFEHEWEKTQGEHLVRVLSRLPEILHEDLVYPIYKKTIAGAPCFVKANEGFYRNLSRKFTEVYFRVGSTIIFEMGVYTDIYFIHKGQCKSGKTTLGRGSVIGDIKRETLMKNTVHAQTNVCLLKIKASEFYLILNNYYETEKEYLDAVATLTDFIPSLYETDPTIEPEVTTVKTKHSMEQSKFELEEVVYDRTNVKKKSIHIRKKFNFKILPDSKISAVLTWIFVADALITVIIVPLLIALRRLYTFVALIIIYSLDSIWILKIICTLSTCFYSEETGLLITRRKPIFLHYLKQFDGLVLDIFSVLPFEMITKIVTIFWSGWNYHTEQFFYIPRLLRVVTLYLKVEKLKKDLSIHDLTRWTAIILRPIIIFSLFASFHIFVSEEPLLYVSEDDTDVVKVLNALLWGYLSAFNLFSRSNLKIFPPTTLSEISISIIFNLFAMCEKCILMGEVLAIINGAHYVMSEKLYNIQLMNEFLSKRDISPAMKKKVTSYSIDLLQQHKLEVMPFFLRKAPYHIKVLIMQDLYLDYLRKCDVFRGVKSYFLKQLAARFQRHIYFPSDTIVEAGDVDNCIHFIHRGEIARVENDKNYAGLHVQTRIYFKGDHFGMLQGLKRNFPHSFTYQALVKSDVLSLNFHDWEDLRTAFPDISIKIMNRANEFHHVELNTSSSDMLSTNEEQLFEIN